MTRMISDYLFDLFGCRQWLLWPRDKRMSFTGTRRGAVYLWKELAFRWAKHLIHNSFEETEKLRLFIIVKLHQ